MKRGRCAVRTGHPPCQGGPHPPAVRALVSAVALAAGLAAAACSAEGAAGAAWRHPALRPAAAPGGVTAQAGARPATAPALAAAPAGTAATPGHTAPSAGPASTLEAGPSAPASTLAPTPRFADVPPTFWAAAAIDGLAGAGLMEGTGPGVFDPDAPISRAEFAAVLDAVRGLPAGVPGPSFSDVPAGAWYAPAVEAVAGEGWMEGAGGGAFRPDAQVTRAEAAVAVVSALGLGQVAADSTGRPCPWTDCGAIPAWGRGSLAVAAGLGLVEGNGQAAVLPDAALTRAEAAVLLWRLRSVGPAAIGAQAATVAADVDVAAARAGAEVGAADVLTAVVHDAQGWRVPAPIVWSVSGPGRLEHGAGGYGAGTATLVATGPGAITVTAAAGSLPGPGSPAAGSVRLQAYRAVRVAVAGLPPAGLRGARFPVRVEAVQASGAPDPAPAGGDAVIRAQPAGGRGPVRSASAPFADGAATVSFPALPQGTYAITVIWPGLPALRLEYTAVTHPVGALRLSASAASVVWGNDVRVAAQATASRTAWPVEMTAGGTDLGAAPAAGDPPAPGPLAVIPAVAELRGGAPWAAAASVRGQAPGSGTVRIEVPGGALRPATVRIDVRAAGSFGPAGGAPTDPASSAAQPVTVAASVRGAVGDVSLEPVDPAGHPLPSVPAAVRGGVATARFTPDQAGVWRLIWRGSGAVPTPVGSLDVRPGPPASLVLDATPTPILLPGEAVRVRAWLADAHGNPVGAPFQLRVETQGAAAPAGTLTLSGGRGALSVAGPATVGTFRAGSGPGTTVVTATSPDHPDLPAARLVLRTESAAAGAVAGPGIWVTFPDWKAEGSAGVVAEALRDHATHIYFEVATSSDGFYGARGLDSLLPQAHAAGLAVISWIYPALDDPAADLSILRAAATYRTPGGDRADGVALDIEDQLQPAAVAHYAAAARALLGPRGLVVGVTWAPQQKPDYPYASLAPYVSAFAPMDYWHTLQTSYPYAEVYEWVRDSVAEVRIAAGRPDVPVDVIAETFDWYSPVTGQGLWSPSALEIEAAARAASDAGAAGISFYRPSTATAAELAVIRSAAGGIT